MYGDAPWPRTAKARGEGQPSERNNARREALVPPAYAQAARFGGIGAVLTNVTVA